MKQTNNAIKFLMAQYRAIFKNANIAMVAAIAAAALASGQAQAAAALDRGALEKLAADTTLTFNGDGAADGSKNTYTNLNLEVADNADDISVSHAHTLTVTGGKDGSGSVFDSKDADQNKTISLSNSTLNLQAGENTDAANAVLKVGASNAVDVKLGTLNVTKGTLEVVKGSISASNITIGKAEAKAPQAIVNVSGTVGAVGNTVKIIDGGLVEAKATGAKLSGNVTVSGGEIKSAGSSDLTITESLNVQSGKLNIAGGKVTLENGGTFADESIVHSGTLVVKGATTVQLTGKFSGAAADTAVLELTDGAVSMDTATLKAITTGKNAKLAVTSKKAGTLVLEGDKVDLADGGVILSDSGEKSDKINLNTDGTLTIKTTEATFGAADTINAKLAFEVDTLTAGKKADGTKLDIDGGATIKVSKALNVQAADATKAALNVISGTVVLNGTNGTKGTLTASAVNLKGAAKDNAKFNITGGDWTVADLAITSGDVSVSNGASLTITDKFAASADPAKNGALTVNAASLNAAGAAITIAAAGGIKLENTATLTLEKSKIVGSNGEIDGAKFAKGAVNGEANTTITIMDGNKKLQFANGDAYKKFYDSTGFKGTLDVDVTMDAQSGSKPIDQILPGLNNDEIYKNVTATTTDGNVTGIKTAGKVEVSTNKDLTLGADTALMLNGAQGGNFVSKTDASGNKVIADVTFGKTGNSLTLKGDGKLGAVSLASSATGSLTIGTHNVASNTTVVAGKDLGAESAALTKIELNNAGSSLTVESGSVYATTLNVNEGADLIVKAGKVVSDNGTVKAGASLTVSGDVTYKKATVDGALKANTLTLSDTGSASNIIEHNFASADVDVTKLVLAQYNQLNIGQDNVDKPEESKTGSVYAGTLELNQGKAFIDPSNSVGYSFLAVNNLKGTVTDDKVAGELNGTVTVGKNAVFGVGFESDQALVDMLAKYTDPKTGALKEFNSALVLNKQVTLTNSTDGITVDPNEDKASATAGNVKFASGSGLVITDEVYDIDTQGNKTGSAIKFTGGTVTLDPTSKLVLIGDFSGADMAFQVFEGATVSGSMKIESANGLLTGTLDSSNGTVGLDFDRGEAEKKGAFADASAPVRELLFGKLSGDVKGKGLGFDLLSDVATGSLSGVVADAAAHAATYAGAQQAAVVSVTTMADAMFGRVGAVGVEAASIAATGSQANGGVWLTPMYKSMDSDGFNAEGVSYGSDVDAAGVAFGADTVNGNMRFGAVFNIGSGDAEGKDNGNGLKDEFDYYGFGIYSAMGFGNFALVGDASMTVVSHDVEGLGLKGKADTTAVTMGVTGQYTVATPAVDVTPHLGARFIRLNTDSYDLVGAKGVVATTDFDVQNVFSVPLGVTLSKGFVAGGWTLAPSADLTVTFNTGDTEAKSTTTFTGAPAIGLNTEVLDEVQYGVTLGLGAQYGAFGTSFGINYTGSSNTDSFGVNAQCRYMF